MGTKPVSLGDGTGSALTTSDDPAMLRAQIAETRNEMGETIEELHGRLNPVVLKEQAIEQFHEATAVVKAELKAHFQEAKETLQAQLKEAKASIKADVIEEVEAVKRRFTEEVTQAKSAMRDATIGKVENMVHGAQKRAHNVRTSVTETVTDNPIPAALAGIGLAWLFIESRRRRVARDEQRYYDANPTSSMPYAYDGSEYRAYAAEGDYTIADADVVELDDSVIDEGGNGHRAREIASRAGRKLSNVAGGAASTVSGIAHGARDTAVGAASRVRETAVGAASRVRETAVGAASRARDGVGTVAHRAHDAAIGIGRGASQGARQVSRRSQDLYRDNPLAVGAALLAAGTVIGLALPRTKVEDQLMGSARDRVLDRAQEVAQGVAHTAIEKANGLVEQVGSSSNNAAPLPAETAGNQRPDVIAGATRPLPGLGRTI